MTVSATELAEGVWQVAASGRLDQNLNPDLDRTLGHVLDLAPRAVIVDLSEVTYINSGGLRCLVSAWRGALRDDSLFAICGLNARLNDIFQMVGFDQVFQVFGTCAEAQAHVLA